MLNSTTYPAQVYQTYKHIQQGFGEIKWERGLYDPTQDYFLEKLLEKAIKFGHGSTEITSGYEGLHGLLHQVPLPFGFNAHSSGIKLFTAAVGVNIYPLEMKSLQTITISTPGVEFFLHQGLNTLSTAVFILVYPALNSSYVANTPSEIKYIVTESAKFFGVNPLETLHSAKSILGENSTAGKAIEYLSYSEHYLEDRANNDDYRQTMDSYNNFMEFTDAFMHAYVELSLILNNQHRSEVPMLDIYLQARLYLYETTNAEEEKNNKKIEVLKLPHNNATCTDNAHIHPLPEESSSWSEWAVNWLYENKYDIYNIAKRLHQAYTIYKTLKPIIEMLRPYAAGHRNPMDDYSEGFGDILALAQEPIGSQQLAVLKYLADKTVTNAIQNALEQTSIEVLSKSFESEESFTTTESVFSELDDQSSIKAAPKKKIASSKLKFNKYCMEIKQDVSKIHEHSGSCAHNAGKDILLDDLFKLKIPEDKHSSGCMHNAPEDIAFKGLFSIEDHGTSEKCQHSNLPDNSAAEITEALDGLLERDHLPEADKFIAGKVFDSGFMNLGFVCTFFGYEWCYSMFSELE